MKASEVELKEIHKVIVHEIHAKTQTADASSKLSNTLLEFTTDDESILIKRIQEGLSNSKKTFQLEYEDRSNDSVFAITKRIKLLDDQDFILTSRSLAENLADAHFRTNIPGGYCLIGTATTTKGAFVLFIIKAELQEAFNTNGNQLQLIKKVFLSPAKDFYKIGLFIENETEFIPFMFDDQFSPQKHDLTEYFYGKFLGLSTDKNDRLRSKNFYESTKSFVEGNISNIKDRTGLINALNVLYREDASGIISPRDFAEKYFEGDLRIRFEKNVVSRNFPTAFTKDISLIESRLELQRITIPLSHNISLIGKSSDIGRLEVIEDPTCDALTSLEPRINTGRIDKIIILERSPTAGYD